MVDMYHKKILANSGYYLYYAIYRARAGLPPMADISSSHYMKLLQASQMKQSAPVLTIKHYLPRALARIVEDPNLSEQFYLSYTARPQYNTTSYLQSENLRLEKQLQQLKAQLEVSSTREATLYQEKLDKMREEINTRVQEIGFLNNLLSEREQYKQCLTLYLQQFSENYEYQRHQRKYELASLLAYLTEQLNSRLNMTSYTSSKYDDFRYQNSLLLTYKRELITENLRLQYIHTESNYRIYDMRRGIGENAAQLEELENLNNQIQLARGGQKYRIIDIYRQLRAEQKKKKRLYDAAGDLTTVIEARQEELQAVKKQYSVLAQTIAYYYGQLNAKSAEADVLLSRKAQEMYRTYRCYNNLLHSRDVIQHFVSQLLGSLYEIASLNDVYRIFDELLEKYAANRVYDLDYASFSDSSDAHSFQFAEQPVRAGSCPPYVKQSQPLAKFYKIIEEFHNTDGQQMSIAVDAITFSQLYDMIKSGQFKGTFGNFNSVKFYVVDKKPVTDPQHFLCECDSIDAAYDSADDFAE